MRVAVVASAQIFGGFQNLPPPQSLDFSAFFGLSHLFPPRLSISVIFDTDLVTLQLFRDFRHWEINPAILDYCFSLFAMIAFMLASYHAGAFSFERGARRRLAFYLLLGVLFGAISLAGAQLPELLIYAGSVFWMLACAQQMLRRSV